MDDDVSEKVDTELNELGGAEADDVMKEVEEEEGIMEFGSGGTYIAQKSSSVIDVFAAILAAMEKHSALAVTNAMAASTSLFFMTLVKPLLDLLANEELTRDEEDEVLAGRDGAYSFNVYVAGV